MLSVKYPKWLELEQAPWTMEWSHTLQIVEQQRKKPRSIYIYNKPRSIFIHKKGPYTYIGNLGPSSYTRNLGPQTAYI